MGNVRLIEPLFVFTKVEHLEGRMRKIVSHTELEKEYSSFCQRYKEHRGAFQKLGDGYEKLYNSYVSERDKVEADRMLKDVLRIKVVEAIDTGKVSMYRLGKDLGLNQGNVFAFLKQKKLSVMSLDNVRAMFAYVKEL
jgi:hypothetical protein